MKAIKDYKLGDIVYVSDVKVNAFPTVKIKKRVMEMTCWSVSDTENKGREVRFENRKGPNNESCMISMNQDKEEDYPNETVFETKEEAEKHCDELVIDLIKFRLAQEEHHLKSNREVIKKGEDTVKRLKRKLEELS